MVSLQRKKQNLHFKVPEVSKSQKEHLFSGFLQQEVGLIQMPVILLSLTSPLTIPFVTNCYPWTSFTGKLLFILPYLFTKTFEQNNGNSIYFVDCFSSKSRIVKSLQEMLLEEPELSRLGRYIYISKNLVEFSVCLLFYYNLSFKLGRVGRMQ